MIVMFSIDPAITGAIIGAISAWILVYSTESYKFNKKKKGVSTILISEIELNLTNIKKFKNSYLNATPKKLYDKGTLEDMSNFYYYLRKFPIITHENWDRLIEFIPDIYDDPQIKEIINFNRKLDNLKKECEILYEKGMPNRTYSAFLLYELDPDDYEVTLGVYTSIVNNINDAIKTGENILKSLK